MYQKKVAKKVLKNPGSGLQLTQTLVVHFHLETPEPLYQHY